MRNFYISIFLMAFLYPGLAASQTLELVSSNIVDGSSEIALDTQVMFTFSLPLNTGLMQDQLNDFILTNLEDDLWDYVSFSENGLSIRFDIPHEIDSDYTWIILGAVAESGERLMDPYVLRYSTATSMGPHTIRGQVIRESVAGKLAGTQHIGLQSAEQPEIQQIRLNDHEAALAFSHELEKFSMRESGLGPFHQVMEQKFRSATQNVKMPSSFPTGLKSSFNGTITANTKEIQNLQNTSDDAVYHTLVVLTNHSFSEIFLDDMNGNDDYNEEENGESWMHWVVLANPDDGTFSIPYVRDGTYYLIAVEIPLYTDDFFFSGVGYYEDNDGNQFFEVSNDISGLEITLSAFEPILAKAAIQQIRTYLDEAEITADIIYAMCFDLPTSAESENMGTCLFWMVVIYEPEGGEGGEGQVYMAAVMPSPFGVVEVFPLEEEDLDGIDLSIMIAIPEDIIDSDVAHSVAESNGGADFRAQLLEQEYLMFYISIEGGHNYWEYPFVNGMEHPEEVPLHWRIGYYSFAYNEEKENWEHSELSVYVDMISGDFLGEVVSADDEVDHQLPLMIRLEQNYPNPFNPVTTIPFQLTENGQVRLTIFDVLGRIVAVLVDDTLPAGKHQVTFQAGHLPSGLYLYQLDTGNHTEILKMLMIK